MVRAAAKNYNDVTVVTSIDQYDELIKELNSNNGATSIDFRIKMSKEAFTETSYYDSYFKLLQQNNNDDFPKEKCLEQI